MTGREKPFLNFRRSYDAAQLVARHPPILRRPNKALVFSITCPPDATHRGTVGVTRWEPLHVPATVSSPRCEVRREPGFYDYAASEPGIAAWHVNFADPRLFAAYGSALLAQDELQVVEHPALGSVREALSFEGLPALTEQDGRPTPVLVTGVERRCVFATDPDLDAGRPQGLYGNRFGLAQPDAIRKAVHMLSPTSLSNILAIAAPRGGRGPYLRHQLESILATAYSGFSAAVYESGALWPGHSVEVRTGFWGCGAFGGNRQAMTLLQILAANLAGVARIRFYAVDAAGLEDLGRGIADFEGVLSGAREGEPLAGILDRIEKLGYEWGASDGN